MASQQLAAEQQHPSSPKSCTQPYSSPGSPHKCTQRGECNVACPYQQPTWTKQREPPQQDQPPSCSSQNKESSIRGVPRHQEQQSYYHHLHHHHHFHHQSATNSCCCPPSHSLSSSSPSLPQWNAEHSSPSSHTSLYPLRISTATVDAPTGPPSCTNYPLQFIVSSPLCCLAHTENSHTLALAISPFQQSTHLRINGLHDLYAVPCLTGFKRPKKPRTQKPKGSKRFPPLPAPAASPPYVICQHCFQLLALPLHTLGDIDPRCSVVRLRCALCMRVSFFSTRRSNLLSSCNAVCGPGIISALDSATDGVNADSQSKEVLRQSMGNDKPTTISSDGSVSELKVDQQNVLNPDFYLPSDGKVQQETEKGNKHECLDTLDASRAAHPTTPTRTTAIEAPTGELSSTEDDLEVMETHMPIITCVDGTDPRHRDSLKNACVRDTDLLPCASAMDASIGEHHLVKDDVQITEVDMPVIGSLRYACLDGTNLRHCEEPLHSPPRLNPEFSGFSSVQDWVNSLEQESFSPCPTPLMGTAFGSDILLREPLQWQTDDQQGNEMAVPPVPGSPLHEHFGYKSARELLHKTLSSDDEIKAHSDTNSSPSTSNASANTFKPPGFDNVGKPTAHTSLTQPVKSHAKISRHAEQEDQISLAYLLKRSFKSFSERKSLSMSSGKLRVVVNGHALSEVALKRAEERTGKLRAGTYWYDSMAGFWGVVGGPCLGVLPPFIEELHYPMAGNCSNGDTQVFVNGRELHHRDLQLLSHRGLSKKPGRAYAISFDGVVIDEASGEELKHIGKLAPTVEKRGKGFGMYTEKLRR